MNNYYRDYYNYIRITEPSFITNRNKTRWFLQSKILFSCTGNMILKKIIKYFLTLSAIKIFKNC